MTYKTKVEQWRALKASKKTLDARITKLRHEIITELPMQADPHGVSLQERNKTTYNEDKVHDVMQSKGIARACYCKYVIDEVELERCYYEGVLTDADLRYIREPQYIYALVEKGVEDVQGEDDNLC